MLRLRVDWAWLIPIPILAFVAKLILLEGSAGTFGDWIPGRYNWEGKLLAIILFLGVVAALFRNKLSFVGLTWSQDGPFRNIALCLALFCAVSWGAASIFQFPGVRSAPLSDVLYQFTMPTLEEERWYRGILLAMLFKGFDQAREQGAPVLTTVLAVLVSSLSFWGAHAIGTDGNWGVLFDVSGHLIAGAFGLIWAVIRVGTGSLLLPMLLHTWTNTAGYII
ncbi:MAG: CPBP family intramembrane metalloprotease [Henriciella sp.]|nr:CPBP family intramembrane metalloprotease [Henriciella sp.]